MKVVTPFRPFAAESEAHCLLGPFDWHGALLMLQASVRRSCRCETVALTDVDTTLPISMHRYATEHRRLMLWILEVSLRYLQSDDFDQDTVMVCPDILVLGDLRRFFRADLGVIVRLEEKFVSSGRPLLNSVQWWRVKAKARLVAFYRRALAIAEGLSEDAIRWGADTIPLVELLSPLALGAIERAGLTVSAVDQAEVMIAFSATMLRRLHAGRAFVPMVPLLDFKYLRKAHMAEYFRLAFRTAVVS